MRPIHKLTLSMADFII